MRTITITVEQCEDSGALVARWDDPSGKGGITTQGRDLSELEMMVKDAVRCHFDEGKAPSRIVLHFVRDAVLQTA